MQHKCHFRIVVSAEKKVNGVYPKPAIIYWHVTSPDVQLSQDELVRGIIADLMARRFGEGEESHYAE